MDIGIVPNLIPLKDEALSKKQLAPFSPLLQPHESDFLFRFKNTTNPGRIYVFSQLGNPGGGGHGTFGRTRQFNKVSTATWQMDQVDGIVR